MFFAEGAAGLRREGSGGDRRRAVEKEVFVTGRLADAQQFARLGSHALKIMGEATRDKDKVARANPLHLVGAQDVEGTFQDIEGFVAVGMAVGRGTGTGRAGCQVGGGVSAGRGAVGEDLDVDAEDRNSGGGSLALQMEGRIHGIHNIDRRLD